ncbi:MAG: AAA family ATPase [Planctomycetota bacterium]
MRTFAVINQKGGCGKTTTSINLAAAFAELGQRTLLVDVDPQGHCALGLAVPEGQLAETIADAMLHDPAAPYDMNDVLWQISTNLDLAPSAMSLAAVEQKLAGAVDRDRRLSRVLDAVKNDYAVCIIDCPPNIGLLTFNALRAASEVIIPVETGYFALAGAVKQAATLQVLADRCGHDVCFHVLPTMYDVRTKMAREIVNELRKHFGDRVLSVPVHYNAKLKEATSFGQPISEYDPASRGCQDFDRLARHLMAQAPMAQRFPMPAAVDMDPVPVTAPAGRTAAALRSPVPAPLTPENTSTAGAPAMPVAEMANTATDATPPNSRAADLVQRARALTQRTAQLQERLASDPDVQRARTENDLSPAQPADPSVKRTLDEKLSQYYGVQLTQQGALFVQPGIRAKRVCVAGDFNNWSPVANPMEHNDRLGVWQTCLPLDKGRYRYRLIIDGRWSADPHNKSVETNPFGELNSIVEVG